MRVVITSRGFAEKGEFQGSSSPNDPESILREAGFEVVNLSSAGFGAQSTENEIFEALIAAASGKLTKSELFGMGSDEFIVWWLGTTA